MVKALAFRLLQFAILWPLCVGSMVQADDHGDTPNDATQIQIGNSFLAELESSNDVDVFRFEVFIPRTVVVESSANLDTFGLLLTETGVPIVAADDTGSNLNVLSQAELNSATYFLGVSFAGLGFPGSYRIRTEFSQSPVADHHAASIETPGNRYVSG